MILLLDENISCRIVKFNEKDSEGLLVLEEPFLIP